MKRVLWAIETNAGPEVLASREEQYYEAVAEWNENLRAVHNQVRILIGEEEALAFLDYEDDYQQDRPTSLHYRFVYAHRQVMAAKSDRTVLESANRAVDELNWCMSSFLFDVTTLFTRRANALALFQLPSAMADAQKQRYISGPPAEFARREPGTSARGAP